MAELERPGLHGLTTEQLSYVESLEHFVGARSIQISRNGRFPNWSPDRWISVLTFLSVVIGGIFFAGGRWQSMSRDIEGLRESLASLTAQVERNRSDTSREIRALSTQLQGRTLPRPRPTDQ